MNRSPSAPIIEELQVARDTLLAERDFARRVACTLEAETARLIPVFVTLRSLHHIDEEGWCAECRRPGPCRTRRAVDDALADIGWASPR